MTVAQLMDRLMTMPPDQTAVCHEILGEHAWTPECERLADKLEDIFASPRDADGRFVTPRSWIWAEGSPLHFAAGRVAESVPWWDHMACDFCGEPVGSGDVYVRVLGGGHTGEAHLRCPWWVGIGVDPEPIIRDWVDAAEGGCWDTHGTVTFDELREVDLSNLTRALEIGEIDEGLEDLLVAINSHPRVCTSYSCRGHDGEDGGIIVHTDDGGLAGLLKRRLTRYRTDWDMLWDRAYSRPEYRHIRLTVPADEDEFEEFAARLLDALGSAKR